MYKRQRQYRVKSKEAHASTIEQLGNDLLSKQKSKHREDSEHCANFKKALKQIGFGDNSYRFPVERNPDYAKHHNNEIGLFATALMD